MSAPGAPPKLAGRLLIASPELLDPNFARTLVYMVAHDAQGALGLVVNRPMRKKLKDILEDFPGSDVLGEMPVGWGGPVERDKILTVVFRPGRRGRIEAQLSLPLSEIVASMRAGDCWVRSYTGYAGWSAGQLESELKGGAWRVGAMDAAVLDDRLAPGLWPFFAQDDMRWKIVVPHLPMEPDQN